MHRAQGIRLFVSILLILCSTSLPAQEAKQKGLDAITREAVRGQLEFLGSDWTEGRSTIERGGFLASDYIASMFQVYGLKPGGDFEAERQGRFGMRRRSSGPKTQTYFQNIDFIESKPGDSQLLALTSGDGTERRTLTFNYRTDFSLSVPSVALDLSAPVVFVGYGMSDPNNAYDEFANVDVRGKAILRLSGFPGHTDTSSAAYKKFRADSTAQEFRRDREKNTLAARHGAACIVEVNLKSDPAGSWIANIPFRVNLPYYEGDVPLSSGYGIRLSLPADTLGGDPPVIAVTRRVAEEILKGSGISLAAFDRRAAETMKPQSRQVRGKSLRLSTTVMTRVVRGRNVIGVLEGERTDEVLVVGAHYDHVGMAGGYIWNGADDNASGTVGVMTIAKACAASGAKPAKTIIFAAWTGEEKGLLGSEYFTEHPPVPLTSIIMYLNFDMIARNSQEDSLGVGCSASYTLGYPELKEVTEKNNTDHHLGLQIRFRGSERPGGGSDHASFAQKDVPIIGFMAAMHPDYHLPTDDVSKVNWAKMTNIIKLGFLDIWDLATREGKLTKAAP